MQTSEIHFDNLVDLEKQKMLQNENLDAKIGVDTAENEPSKVFKFVFIFLYPVYIWSLITSIPKFL